MEKSSYKNLSPFRKFLVLINEDRREFLSVVIYSLFQSLLLLAVPLAAQSLVNVVVSGLYLQPLVILTLALLFGLLAAGLLTLIRFYLVEVMRERIFARVALRVADRLPRVCHLTLLRSNGPELMNRFFDVVNIQKSWFKLAYDGPGAVLEILVGIFLLAFYGTELFGMSVVLCLGGTLLVCIAGYKGLYTSLKESSEKYHVAEWLEEMVKCQDALKLNSRPDYWAEEADRRVVNFLKKRRQHFWIIIRQKTVYYFISAIALSGMLGLGGYLVIEGDLSLGQLVAAELVIWGILKASQKLIGLVEAYFDLLTGLEKVGLITTMETDKQGAIALRANGTGAAVCFDSIFFTYGPSLPPALDTVSLEIKSGEIVTVLGEPGSGKSTLVKLIAGFLKPVKGSVEIDSVDLREFEPESLAQNVAIVSRESDLFAGTLLENVSTGREISIHTFKKLLDACRGRNLVKDLPDGVNSTLTSSGRDISGSEKDTLLLSRALLGHPRLLLLDEALGHLSELQHASLASYLQTEVKGCTVVSTLASAPLLAVSDRVIILEEGKVAESGSFEDLAKEENSRLRSIFPGLTAASLEYLRRGRAV